MGLLLIGRLFADHSEMINFIYRWNIDNAEVNYLYPSLPSLKLKIWDFAILIVIFIFITFVFGHTMWHRGSYLLVLWSRIEPMPLAVKAWSLNHWTASEVPLIVDFRNNEKMGHRSKRENIRVL